MLRYRHIGGIQCGAVNRSVPCAIYEADFNRLLKLLIVAPEGLLLMQEWVVQMDRASAPDQMNLEVQKREAIARCQQKIDAAVVLFGDARITREEYHRRIEQNEREIEHWQSRTSDTQKAALELAMCMALLDKLVTTWETGTDEDKQGLARSLFTEVIYNLDTRRTTDFKLKPWAERYLVLCVDLYEAENASTTTKKRKCSSFGNLDRFAPLRRLQPRSCSTAASASIVIVGRIYAGKLRPSAPITNETPRKTKRNEEIRRRYVDGESMADLSQTFQISIARIHQILHGRRK